MNTPMHLIHVVVNGKMKFILQDTQKTLISLENDEFRKKIGFIMNPDILAEMEYDPELEVWVGEISSTSSTMVKRKRRFNYTEEDETVRKLEG